MKLNFDKREVGSHSIINKMRREGRIPAVVYKQGKEADAISVDCAEFQAALRSFKKGRLATSIFTLTSGKTKFSAIVKDIQYHPSTYQIQHLDFVELIDDVPVSLNVPIECIGMDECPGIKLGGVLRQVIRKLPVRCLPKDIPTHFSLSVKGLSLLQSQRLKAIEIPEGLQALCSLNEVAAVIVKR